MNNEEMIKVYLAEQEGLQQVQLMQLRNNLKSFTL